MAIRTYDILLDSYNSTMPEPIVGRQGDKNGAVTLHVTITDRGTAVDLTGQTVNLIAETAKGTAVVADNGGVTLTDAVNGKFDYAIPNALWSEAGKITKAYFSLNDTDGQETTYDLIFIVKKAIDISQNKADDYITVIDGTIRDLKTKVDDIYEAYKNGEFYSKSESDEILGLLSDFKMPGTTVADKINGEFEDRGVNVKWFGAVGDGLTDDTAAFEAAYLASKNIYIPAGTYYLTGFHVPVGTKITGDNAILELHSGDEADGNNVLAGSKSNSTISGLKIHSLEESLEWNRFDISSQDHIIIRNCEFTGFRHISNAPNAWGIYLDKAKQVLIENCQFNDNSQSDIAIVEGCEDIQINGCFGINDTFYINFEPNNYTDKIKRVSINNCVLSELAFRNYSLNNQDFEQITVTSSVIDYLDYYGADLNFISSKINHVNQSLLGSKPTDTSAISSGGVLKLNGALNLSSNLVVDPTMDSYATVTGSNANWTFVQGTLNATTGTTRYEDQFGSLTRIGTKTTDKAQLLFTPKLLLESADNNVANCYQVAAGDQFLATLAGWAHYDTTASWISLNASAAFYDDSGNFISEVHLSLCKSQAGTDTPYNRYSAFITVPDNVTGMRLKVGECTVATSVSTLYFGAFSLQRILTTTNANNGDINLYPLPVGSRRRFRSATIPSSAYGWCHYQEGDICYKSIPTKGQPYGWICVNQGYPGDWLPLGNI